MSIRLYRFHSYFYTSVILDIKLCYIDILLSTGGSSTTELIVPRDEVDVPLTLKERDEDFPGRMGEYRSKLKMDWSGLGRGTCLNLKKRHDRYRSSKEIFNRLGLEVDYLHVDGNPSDRIGDNFKNHVEMMKKALDNGQSYCLIFEDDIVENPDINQKMIDDVVAFISSDLTWDIFYLGHQPDVFSVSSPTEMIGKVSSIHKVRSLCTHAYLVNRHFAVSMINKFSYLLDDDLKRFAYPGMYKTLRGELRDRDGNEPIDNYIKDVGITFAIYPMFFYQSSSPSDISDIQWTMRFKSFFASFSELHMHYLSWPGYVTLIILIFLVLLVVFVRPHRF